MEIDLKSASSGFGVIQAHVGTIYVVSNNRLFTLLELGILLQRSTTKLLKAVRKGKQERINNGLIAGVGWVIAIANRLSIDIEKELLVHFPGVCPYCGKKPCDPSFHDSNGRKDLSHLHGTLPPQSFHQDQLMWAGIYPENTLSESAQHLVEEAAEVLVAMHAFLGTHDPDLFHDIGMELVDVLAHLCAVASCSKFNLSEGVIEKYRHGCPWCGPRSCICTFKDAVNSC